MSGPAFILHTMHNLAWAVLAAITVSESKLSYAVSGDTSLIVIICYALLTVWVLHRLRKERT
ncbi:hypothetical protein [Paenibacillus mendelii]|uniref:Uncharacterized protein n=1 Tax=Paenibacillus mendelii TaxID=206163 RepID=A0ABV6JBS5_9BACL|nr:hypothetical protein [Paenibacillus mendelii]